MELRTWSGFESGSGGRNRSLIHLEFLSKDVSGHDCIQSNPEQTPTLFLPHFIKQDMLASFSLSPVLRHAATSGFHSCLRLAARTYVVAQPRHDTHWTRQIQAAMLPKVENLDKKWSRMSKNAMEDVAQHPPAHPYSGQTRVHLYSSKIS